IAAFSRALDCTYGNIWTWWDSSGGFYVAWDNVHAGSHPQSFFIWVRAQSPPISPNGENAIEFWYSSVTSGDGFPTVIGIADQYGGRVVSIDPTLYQLNNQRVVITATATRVKYLNSLKVSLTDTSSGSADSQAQVVLDPSTNPPGNPLGYNVLVNPSGPPTIDLPDYARVGLGAGSLVTSLSAGRIASGLTFSPQDWRWPTLPSARYCWELTRTTSLFRITGTLNNCNGTVKQAKMTPARHIFVLGPPREGFHIPTKIRLTLLLQEKRHGI